MFSPLINFFLASIVGGLTGALVKLSEQEFPPILLAMLRFGLSTLIILPFILKQRLPLFNNNRKFLLLANLLFTGNMLLFALGIQYTTVIMGQLLYVPSSLLVAIIGFLVLGEKLSKNQIIGLVLSLVGIFILIFNSIKIQDMRSFGTFHGNLLVISALICWSFYLVVSRKISGLYSPSTIIFYNFLTATLISLFLILLNIFPHNIIISTISSKAIISLVALVIFSTVIVYYFFQTVVKQTSAFISSLILYVNTVIAAIVGIVFFNERLTLNLVLGGLLVIIGVFSATSYQYAKNYLKLK